MAQRFLFDTDVLIDYLRNRPAAVSCVEQHVSGLTTSALVVAELHAGVRDGAERVALDSLIRAFEVIPVDNVIAESGGLLRRDFGPAHGTGIVDALIAATAQQLGARLVTLNKKHFPMLRNVLVPYKTR
jgi:predicted nucleic acid-binding protein